MHSGLYGNVIAALHHYKRSNMYYTTFLLAKPTPDKIAKYSFFERMEGYTMIV